MNEITNVEYEVQKELKEMADVEVMIMQFKH